MLPAYRLTAFFFGHVRHVRPLQLVQRPILNGPFSTPKPCPVQCVDTKCQNVIQRLSYLLETNAFRFLRVRKETHVVLIALLFR